MVQLRLCCTKVPRDAYFTLLDSVTVANLGRVSPEAGPETLVHVCPDCETVVELLSWMPQERRKRGWGLEPCAQGSPNFDLRSSSVGSLLSMCCFYWLMNKAVSASGLAE